jgi:asparagine synthetase A
VILYGIFTISKGFFTIEAQIMKGKLEKNNHLGNLKELLYDASEILSQQEGGYSDHFDDAEEFYIKLQQCLQSLENGDVESINSLYKWFAPTSDWDDLVDEEGIEIGNKVFGLLTRLLEKGEKGGLDSSLQ